MAFATRIDPGAAVGRRAQIAVVPAILHPGGNIAVDIAQAEWVGGELADRRRPPESVGVMRKRIGPAPQRGRFVAIAGEVRNYTRRCAFAPPEPRLRASAQGVPVFCLARQAIALAGMRRQPVRVGVGIVPRHVDYRLVVARGGPGVVAAPVDLALVDRVPGFLIVNDRDTEAIGIGFVAHILDETAEFGDRDLVAPERKAAADLHFAPRLLACAMPDF